MGMDQILPISPTGSALSAVDEHRSFDDDGVSGLEEGASESNSPPVTGASRSRILSVDTACKSPNGATRSLSSVSDKYDREHKGWLDPTERKMRELDKFGLGYLDNNTVYNMMRESMGLQRKMVTQRWLMFGLGVFALVLAIANMGTALIAARLTKETEVTSAGDLASKYNHERVGTTAKAMSFDLGATKHNSEIGGRRLGLLGDIVRQELGSFNAIQLDTAKVLWKSFDTDGSAVQLRWTCGIGGGGSSFAVPVVSAECTPYSLNVTDTDDIVSGIIYEYHIRNNHVVSKTLLVDCVDGALECVVTGTDCCGSGADCGERQKCSMCGCHCVDIDEVVPMCMSSPPCGGGFDAW